MKKRQIETPYKIAILLFTLRSVFTYLLPLPDSISEVVSELLIGMSSVAIIFGFIPKHMRLRFRNYKKHLFLRSK